MKWLIIAIITLKIKEFGAIYYSTNITDFSKCKVHYSRQERNYGIFYHIAEQGHLKTSNDTVFDFHFSVLARSDAHILLSPSAKITNDDPVYEIVIGAGGNSFCDIRRKQKGNVKASVRIKDTLSAIEIKSFWIHVYKDGLIDVGREGEELGFISYKDNDPLPIDVFSFCTWGDVEAKWFFDCERPNKTSDVEEIEKLLSADERLKKDLFMGYDPYATPLNSYDEQLAITVNINPQYIALDEKLSVMTMKGVLFAKWIDQKIQWEPSDYENVRSMHIHNGQIWKPNFYIQNAVSLEAKDAFYNAMVMAAYDGKVEWRPHFKIETFCDLDSFKDWPNDEHTCRVDVSLWNIDYKNIDVKFEFTKSIYESMMQHEWEILELKVLPQEEEEVVTALNIKLRRISKIYQQAFVTPFFVIATSMLLSFCASPFGYVKILLICIQLILTSIILIGLNLMLPGHSSSVPYFVHLYSATMLGNVWTALVAVIVINFCRVDHKYDPPYSISKILNMKFIEFILLLPKHKISNWKGNLTKPTTKDMWIRCGIAIDRVTCLITVALILSAVFIKY